MTSTFQSLVVRAGSAALLALASAAAHSAPYYWTDWTSSTSTTQPNFVANGSITTNSTTINVTYSNAQGVFGIQTGSSGAIDYWANGLRGVGGRNPLTSPYTSTQVDNIPTGTDIIQLQNQGTQTLQFSQTIANPVFAFVSLNGNGYSFVNQDFEILSLAGQDGNDIGYWGYGPVQKVVSFDGNGNTIYSLNATGPNRVELGGEPHGVIRFLGSFDTLQWNSQNNEAWNGFTVGVQGTAVEVFRTPEPGSLALLGVALLGVAATRRKREA